MRNLTDVRRSPRRPRRPRWRRPGILVGVAIVPVVVGVMAYGWLALRHAPDAYRLDPAATADTGAPPRSAGDLAGRWVVARGSQAGYRIREKLARLPAPNDAVGRTGDVRGEMTVAELPGGALVARDARFEADLTTLRSDEPSRDEKVFPMFLEPGGGATPRFPTATFQARAVDVPSQVRSGAPVDLLVRGQLTIRGERHDADVRMRARVHDRRVELVGSTRFPLARYGIVPPDFGGFVKLDEQVTLEFRLYLNRRA